MLPLIIEEKVTMLKLPLGRSSFARQANAVGGPWYLCRLPSRLCRRPMCLRRRRMGLQICVYANENLSGTTHRTHTQHTECVLGIRLTLLQAITTIRHIPRIFTTNLTKQIRKHLDKQAKHAGLAKSVFPTRKKPANKTPHTHTQHTHTHTNTHIWAPTKGHHNCTRATPIKSFNVQ